MMNCFQVLLSNFNLRHYTVAVQLLVSDVVSMCKQGPLSSRVVGLDDGGGHVSATDELNAAAEVAWCRLTLSNPH